MSHVNFRLGILQILSGAKSSNSVFLENLMNILRACMRTAQLPHIFQFQNDVSVRFFDIFAPVQTINTRILQYQNWKFSLCRKLVTRQYVEFVVQNGVGIIQYAGCSSSIIRRNLQRFLTATVTCFVILDGNHICAYCVLLRYPSTYSTILSTSYICQSCGSAC